MIDALAILTFLGFIIIIGFIGSYFFHKTKIPDVILLLILGLIINYFNLVNTEMFILISPLLAALALILILFGAGLNMDIYKVIKESPRSMLLALLNIVFSMFIISIFSYYFLNLDLLLGMLLGSIIGGISSPIVISILEDIKIEENLKTILDLESIWSDVLCIVIAISLMQIISLQTTASFSSVSNILLGTFSIGIVLGLFVGIVWLSMFSKLKGKRFEYMLTLAVLFLLYVFVENINGSGAIAVLMFGLVLGNGKFFSTTFKLKEKITADRLIRRLHEEISFFIKTFFFIYLGLVFSLQNINLLIYGIIITAILLVTRFVSVRISLIKMNIIEFDKRITQFMIPRGLAAAVLAGLPVIYGIHEAYMFPDIVFIVILTSIMFSSIGIIFTTRKRRITVK